MNTEQDGIEYLENYIQNKKPADQCQRCGKKLTIFNHKEIMLRFGLTHQVCKDCYKQIKKETKKQKQQP